MPIMGATFKIVCYYICVFTVLFIHRIECLKLDIRQPTISIWFILQKIVAGTINGRSYFLELCKLLFLHVVCAVQLSVFS